MSRGCPPPTTAERSLKILFEHFIKVLILGRPKANGLRTSLGGRSEDVSGMLWGLPLNVPKLYFTFLTEYLIDLIYLNSMQSSEAYLEASRTTTIELFYKNS